MNNTKQSEALRFQRNRCILIFKGIFFMWGKKAQFWMWCTREDVWKCVHFVNFAQNHRLTLVQDLIVSKPSDIMKIHRFIFVSEASPTKTGEQPPRINTISEIPGFLYFTATSCRVHFESSRQVVNIRAVLWAHLFSSDPSKENCWQFKWCWL